MQILYQPKYLSEQKYTQMHLMLCISSIKGFSYMLNTFNFHCLYFEKKINVLPVTIEILNSFKEHDFMI